jgi:tetratricopeptide (TPR) repeat protein
MKRVISGTLFILCLGAAVHAQEWSSFKSRYYELFALENSTAVLRLGMELDLRYDAYNEMFRFDPALRRGSLKVRIFTDKAGYDAYVTSKLGSTRDGAVYLHYSTADSRELVVNSGSEGLMLPHQSFVQFFRAFISNPPSWIREGAAVYFNGYRFNGEKETLEYEENTAWLDTVKKLFQQGGENIPAPEAVFLADKSGLPGNFQAFSWALVSFFLAGENLAYYRSFTDSFMVLVPAATAEANSDAVYSRMSFFNAMEELQDAFSVYIDSKKTFTELVNAGQKAYREKNFTAAEGFFRSARELKKDSYIPSYFLGLVSYELKNYDRADDYYDAALKLGAERALIQYARGLNAAAAGKNAAAIQFLQDASDASPEKYKTRADDLIRRLK